MGKQLAKLSRVKKYACNIQNLCAALWLQSNFRRPLCGHEGIKPGSLSMMSSRAWLYTELKL